MNMMELFQRIVDAEKKEYIELEELTAVQQAVVKEIVDIQAKIKEITTQVDKLREKKAELDPVIIEALRQLQTDGVRLEKALVFIREGTAVPSFAQVYKVVKEKLTPKIDKLLTETYEGLTKKLLPSLGVKTEAISDVWNKIVNFFKNLT